MGSLLSLYLRAAPHAVGVSKATQTEWNCPVCRSVHSNAAAVPCGHQFCLGCLLRHTATSATCPLCASPVLSARFSVLSRTDFLQCLLSPAGALPAPGTWVRRPVFRLVFTAPRPATPQGAAAQAEPAGPQAEEQFPAELWAELLQGHEWLLDTVRPWLRHSLETIYGAQWWEARQVETIALATLYMCGPNRAELTHMLQGYLGDYTAPLIQGLIHITLHGCREAWLRRRALPAPGEDQDEAESPAGSAGPSSPGGTPALGLAPDPAGPGLGNQPSGSGGPGRPPVAPAPAGQDQPHGGPEQHRAWAGPEQDRAWAGPEQDRAWAGPEEHQPYGGPEQHRAWAGPEQDLAWAGPEQHRAWAGPEQHRAWAGPEQDRAWAGPEQHRAWAGPEQDQAWPGAEQDRPRGGPGQRQRRPRSHPEQDRPRAGPRDDAPAPGPSMPRRGRNRWPRSRVTRHSQRRRAWKSCRPFWGRRRKPRRK